MFIIDAPASFNVLNGIPILIRRNKMVKLALLGPGDLLL